ncbi:MAG: exodeoxyribonuclease VII small subunit [Clostridiaceae bacterium]
MKSKAVSYEDKLKRLEEILSLMEGNNVSLEESINLYEEGVILSNELQSILKDAEGRIKIITDRGEEIYTEKEV